MTHDTYNRILTKTYQDAQGQPIVTTDGYSRIEYAYDGYNRVMIELYQDAQGNPVTVQGYQGMRFARDAMGRITQEYFVKADGTTLVDSTLGYAVVMYQYDRYGNVSELVYYGADGWGATDANGINRIERQYDEKGNLISEMKYDLNRKPVQ